MGCLTLSMKSLHSLNLESNDKKESLDGEAFNLERP